MADKKKVVWIDWALEDEAKYNVGQPDIINNLHISWNTVLGRTKELLITKSKLCAFSPKTSPDEGREVAKRTSGRKTHKTPNVCLQFIFTIVDAK